MSGFRVDGEERWRGPRDLVIPIHSLDSLLDPSQGHPAAPDGTIPKIKRSLGDLLCRYAVNVKMRPADDRTRDINRAVALLQEAMTESAPGSFDYTTAASSLVATVEQGRAAGLLPPG